MEATIAPLPLGSDKGKIYYVINHYIASRGRKEPDGSHRAYSSVATFDDFERMFLNPGQVIKDVRMGVQLVQAAAYAEAHKKLADAKLWFTGQREDFTELDNRQYILVRAHEALDEITDDIRSTWDVQGVLARWGSHCQGLHGAIRRFERPLFEELLHEWLDTRLVWLSKSPEGVAWLDDWMKKLKEKFMIEDDLLQFSCTWSKIHDCGDETYIHQVVKDWQRKINIFRFKHRKASSLAETIQGMQARLIRYKDQIVTEAKTHGWNQTHDYFDIKLDRYAYANYQLMHLELRERLEQNPWQRPFTDLDIVAFNKIKNRTVETINGTRTFGELSASPIVRWLDHFIMLLPYDSICVGFAWNFIRWASEQQPDCFLMINASPRTGILGPLSSPSSPIARATTRAFLAELQTFYSARKEAYKRHKRRQTKTADGSSCRHSSADDGVMLEAMAKRRPKTCTTPAIDSNLMCTLCQEPTIGEGGDHTNALPQPDHIMKYKYEEPENYSTEPQLDDDVKNVQGNQEWKYEHNIPANGLGMKPPPTIPDRLREIRELAIIPNGDSNSDHAHHNGKTDKLSNNTPIPSPVLEHYHNGYHEMPDKMMDGPDIPLANNGNTPKNRKSNDAPTHQDILRNGIDSKTGKRARGCPVLRTLPSSNTHGEYTKSPQQISVANTSKVQDTEENLNDNQLHQNSTNRKQSGNEEGQPDEQEPVPFNLEQPATLFSSEDPEGNQTTHSAELATPECRPQLNCNGQYIQGVDQLQGFEQDSQESGLSDQASTSSVDEADMSEGGSEGSAERNPTLPDEDSTGSEYSYAGYMLSQGPGIMVWTLAPEGW